MSDLIVSDPAIRGGEWVIAGTRFPVWLIHGLRDGGRMLAYMLEQYPALVGHEDGIAAALAFPARREADVWVDPQTGSALEVRESWIPGEVEIVAWHEGAWDEDSMLTVPYERIPALIAALETALTWGQG